jgi:hypothetical protein
MSNEDTVNNMVLIIGGYYSPILVEYKHFVEIFDVEGSCAKPKDIEWHNMSGGFDTWCQSNSVGHARAGFEYGKQIFPYIITHIYFLKE